MRFLITLAKIIAISVVSIVVIYILFSSQLSAFWYNRYEAQFAVEFTKVIKMAASIEDMISRRQQLSGAPLSDLSDLNWLKNEVLSQLSSEKTALDAIDKIARQQSRIPLLETHLAAYHQKKLAWVSAQKQSLDLYIDVKNTEYRVYDIAARLSDAQDLITPPTNMDMNVWRDNSIKGGKLAQSMLDEIQRATEDKILTQEYEKNLVSSARHIDVNAQLNLRAMSGEISWDFYLVDLGKLNAQYPRESVESVNQMGERWRSAIIDPKNTARMVAYDKAGTTLLAMENAMSDAPLVNDNITKFLIKRGWLKLPSLGLNETQPVTMLASEIEQMKKTLTDPDVIFLRKALNSYINGDTSVCISETARKRVMSDTILAGLDLFDIAYYKSKFTTISVDFSKTDNNYVRVLFIDKPDRIFTAYISLTGDKRCLERFITDDTANNTEVPDTINKYRKYIFDPLYSL